MLAKSITCAVVGLDGVIVEVEVDISPGLPAFHVVGLPDTAVQESRERVRAAIRNSGCGFPMRRIAANLAPADLRKAGPAYDLPIALAVLLSSGQVPAIPGGSLFLGELAMDGALRHTNGILPMVAVAKQEGFDTVFVPAADADEAALVEGVTVIAVNHLAQLVSHLRDDETIAPRVGDPAGRRDDSSGAVSAASSGGVDLADIRGQEHAKRALEVAAAGGHNLLMTGPPGSGKTLLARSLPSVLPELTNQEALEVTKIYSVGGLLPSSAPLISERPFRAPHYTISNAGMVGGGRQPRPGEITLSHRGVLFLDELPEFGHSLLEVLRQPLEDKVVTISRAQGTITFPANFMAGAKPRRSSSVLLGGRTGPIAAYTSACGRFLTREPYTTSLEERRKLRQVRRTHVPCRGRHHIAAVGPSVRSTVDDQPVVSDRTPNPYWNGCRRLPLHVQLRRTASAVGLSGEAYATAEIAHTPTPRWRLTQDSACLAGSISAS